MDGACSELAGKLDKMLKFLLCGTGINRIRSKFQRFREFHSFSGNYCRRAVQQDYIPLRALLSVQYIIYNYQPIIRG